MSISGKHEIAFLFLSELEGGCVSIAEVAERINRSISHLEQLAKKLRTGGLITAKRGAGGGYLLARPLNEIFTADVLKSIGMAGRPREGWLTRAIVSRFEGVTVAELLSEARA